MGEIDLKSKSILKKYLGIEIWYYMQDSKYLPNNKKYLITDIWVISDIIYTS